MSFFRKFFARGPEEYLTKGEGHFAAHSYYEARSAFEAGLQSCRGKTGQTVISKYLKPGFMKQIVPWHYSSCLRQSMPSVRVPWTRRWSILSLQKR